MRGEDQQEQPELFTYGSLEERVPADHPLRPIREMVDQALKTLDAKFDTLYGEEGRPSIPPERLLRALLLQMLYTIRSERMLVEQLNYNLLFRWFVGLSMNEAVWHATVFTKNRDRLLEAEIAQEFFKAVLEQARAKKLLSSEHFTVDGTLLEAWAGQKSFQRKKQPAKADDEDRGNPTITFRGEKRRNDTHESKTDPEARLWRKSGGHEAKLAYQGHVVTENRNGMVVNTRVTIASGRGEREAALAMVDEIPGGSKRVTLGADRGYDVGDFVRQLRERCVTPHVAQKQSSAIDGRTTGQAGYEVSQRKRKRVEEVFGWMKDIALQRKTKFRGLERVRWMFTMAAAAYNLVRMRNLMQQPA